MTSAPTHAGLPVTRSAEPAKGLNCPRCSAPIPIPEGRPLVKCPYCGLTAMVQGERGVPHFQVARKVDHSAIEPRVRRFLGSKMSIARGAKDQATITEAVSVFVPFFSSWVRVLGWVFGRDRVGSGKNRRWVPKEKQITLETAWTAPACDLGEFGIAYIPLDNVAIEPYDDDAVHAQGMVFEPVASLNQAQASAKTWFEQKVRSEAALEDTQQVLIEQTNATFGVVYYPLWMVRYAFRGRVFQVLIDGHTSEVVAGRAPGDTFWRAATLVLGMAGGAFLTTTVGPLIFNFASGDGSFIMALIAMGFGLAVMFGAYQRFRFGEVVEVNKYKAPKYLQSMQALQTLQTLTGVNLPWKVR